MIRMEAIQKECYLIHILDIGRLYKKDAFICRYKTSVFMNLTFGCFEITISVRVQGMSLRNFKKEILVISQFKKGFLSFSKSQLSR